MAKRFLCLLAALLLAASPALGEITVERNEGELFFPQEKNWVYHFVYAYPHIPGEDYTSALINDTYQMALDEMTQLVLPMFANAPDMRFDGKNEVTHDFTVLCNDGHLLSILQTRVQTRGEEGMLYALEPLTFDVNGMYAGETLTLRGVTLVLAGVDGEMLDDAEPELYPHVARVIDGSSDEMAEVLMPVLYEQFKALQESGIMGAEWTYDDFASDFSPTRDFCAGEDGKITFFFPPMLMAQPCLQSPRVSFSPEDLDALLSDL